LGHPRLYLEVLSKAAYKVGLDDLIRSESEIMGHPGEYETEAKDYEIILHEESEDFERALILDRKGKQHEYELEDVILFKSEKGKKYILGLPSDYRREGDSIFHEEIDWVSAKSNPLYLSKIQAKESFERKYHKAVTTRLESMMDEGDRVVEHKILAHTKRSYDGKMEFYPSSTLQDRRVDDSYQVDMDKLFEVLEEKGYKIIDD
ncbi:hypothetical protein HN706_03360, partial [Candidatus Woesearchaeota archaeon]|nr:hypothetical protein [Candidatus Woesearchaeota archaeon]MBT7170101.1 hypothetical protein [Candidatus Woesearchaeota archaeon]MBT7474950.1 hypothetical protein [Candidatus Woesearchaeota archaeon]